MIPHLIKASAITLFPVGEAPITVDAGHINFAAVRQAIADRDWEQAVVLATMSGFFNSISGGHVTVSDDGVFYKEQKLTGYLADTLLRFFQEGLPVEHLCLFLSNLRENPSRTSVEELYLFLEAAKLPITQNGCFLAYKAVKGDYKDKHSGRFDNSPGKLLTMPRNEVDDVRDRTCSYGFHAAAYDYAKNFMQYGDKLVAVEINPKDVVSVPSDYANQKLRTCTYRVLFEVEGASDVLRDKPFWQVDSEWDDAFDDIADGLYGEDKD